MKKWLKWTLIAVLAVLPVLLAWQLDIFSWQKLDTDRIRNHAESTIVYDRNGARMASLYALENRQRARLASVPDHVAGAFITAEDQRFYEHSGVDLRRMFAALIHDIKTMSFSQGASTITQQLVKLTHLTSEKTLARKFQEILLARQLERQMSKDEILEAYLNTVYFGNGAYGIATAAEVYFGKDVSDLSIAEGALLAGIIKSPSRYAPHLHPENALNRRNAILKSMRDASVISEGEYSAAVFEEIELAENEKTAPGSWYTDAVIEETGRILNLDAEEILSKGLHIYTAFYPEMQDNADELFKNGANFPDPAPDGTPVQAAFVAMEPANGEICAMIGGREYEVQRGLNRAIDMRRQPGSAVKPVSTYAAAIDNFDFLPVSMVRDVQREFPGKYLPGNAGGTYYGIVTLREALSRSLNVATVDLADIIGIPSIRDKMAAFGLPLSVQDVNLSLSLGSMTDGVSPAELCASYCALSNGGMQVSAHTVRRITDSSGRILYESPSANQRATKETTAFLLTDMLKTAAESGSAKALSNAGMPVAGKTGTVGENGGGNRDIWTAAYTPDICVAVWMGFDRPDPEHALPDYAGGSSYPAQLCAAFLMESRKLLSGSDFPVPSGLVSAEIDRIALLESDLVMLASENTPEKYVQKEWFRNGTLPTAVSTLWDAPVPVDDLTVISPEGDPPAIAFTSRDAAADYLVIRKDSEESEIAAVLSADAGNIIVWSDADADPNQNHAYSILPRNRLLYDSGVVLTGPESETVRYSPGGLLNRLFGAA